MNRHAASVSLQRMVAKLLVWIAIVAAASPGSAQEEAITPIATCQQMVVENFEELPLGLTHIHGVVTWISVTRSGCIIQDDSAGLFVNLKLAERSDVLRAEADTIEALRVGQMVDVVGHLSTGGFSPQIIPQELQSVDAIALPAPRPFDPALFFSGAGDCQRMVVEGILEWSETTAEEQILHLAFEGRRFTVTLPRAEAVETAAWIDAVMEVTGVATAVFNTRGELLAPRLRALKGTDLRLLVPPPSQPWDAPFLPLNAVARFRPQPQTGHRIRTRGTVTLSVPGSHLYVQQGLSGLRVETLSCQAFSLGDEVEVSGFVAAASPVAEIIAADVKKLHAGKPIPAVRVTPRKVLQINGEAAYRGQLAKPGDFHGALIQFPATVLDVSATSRGGEVLLEAGEIGATLLCEPSAFQRVKNVLPGSDVLVAGIVTAVEGRDSRPLFLGEPRPTDRVELLLPTVADLVVLRPPSWWTPQRLGLALGAVGLAAVIASGWVVGLRSQVRRQLAVIEAGIQESASAEERHRIAREFHDTLEQDLAGIVLQLDAAAHRFSGTKAADVLEEQRRHLARVRSETHDFLWDLRDPYRQSGPFVMAVQSQIEALQTITDVPLIVEADDEFPALSPFVQHHLLRVVREAVANAIRHAEAGEIRVCLEGDDSHLILSIRDNGRGFATHDDPLPAGHFGLRGIRERVRRIGGTVAFETPPSAGTCVTVSVPRGSMKEG